LHLVTNSFITYHENDLKVSTITMIRSVSKSDGWIERYRKLKPYLDGENTITHHLSLEYHHSSRKF